MGQRIDGTVRKRRDLTAFEIVALIVVAVVVVGRFLVRPAYTRLYDDAMTASLVVTFASIVLVKVAGRHR